MSESFSALSTPPEEWELSRLTNSASDGSSPAAAVGARSSSASCSAFGVHARDSASSIAEPERSMIPWRKAGQSSGASGSARSDDVSHSPSPFVYGHSS